MFEDIIRALINSASGCGQSPEYLRGWVESELGKDAAFVFWQIYLETTYK